MMINSTSVKTRFAVSIILNTVRALLSFISGLLVARGLSPSGYGDLMFLLGSFVAIRSLIDMGTSNAFYTFISQRVRDYQFYLLYYLWLIFQFILTVLLITLILPEAMIDKVWLGHSSYTILLGFTASFLQQQVWQTVSQIGEAARKTVKVQILNLSVALFHIAIIAWVMNRYHLTVELVLWIFIIEYIIAIGWAAKYLKDRNSETETAINKKAFKISSIFFKETLEEYSRYCKPLIIFAIIGFFYDFADRWILQKFGGAEQQAYFQVANQFATVSLFMTTSILRVFWKEISEATERKDNKRVYELYQFVNHTLVLLGAVISGLLIPWSEQIVAVFLGNSYALAWPVLAIMLLYPIHQSMGQIGGTMFLASENTRLYMQVGIGTMLVSIPFTYLVLAPASDNLIPGLGLGALGLAIKMVILNIISVNIQAWFIAKYYKWSFEWKYQIIGIGLTITLGYFSKWIVTSLRNPDNDLSFFDLLLFLFYSSAVFIPLMVGMLWAMPWLIKMRREQFKFYFKKNKVDDAADK